MALTRELGTTKWTPSPGCDPDPRRNRLFSNERAKSKIQQQVKNKEQFFSDLMISTTKNTSVIEHTKLTGIQKSGCYGCFSCCCRCGQLLLPCNYKQKKKRND